MESSILADRIRGLESSLDSLESRLTVATALVVLRLLLEYPHEIYDAIVQLRESVAWRPLLTIAGALFITLGVAGELFYQSKASLVEGNLRAANHEVQVRLENETSQAQQRAQEATAATELAKARLAEAGRASSEADARAAQARSIAELERLERIKLEAAVAPRSLSLEQQKQIIAACSGFVGHNVVIYSYGLDGEGAALGGQIISVLQAAHANVFDARSSTTVVGGFEQGIHIRGPEAEREFIAALDYGLRSIGKLTVSVNDSPPRIGAAFGGGGPAIPSGTVLVTIMIGVKPVPILTHPK